MSCSTCWSSVIRPQLPLRSDGALPGPVTIRIRGTHRLAEPLVITPEDSGTAETPVTFTGYAGEKPILSGGRPISGWQKGEGGVWTVKIPQVQAGEWRFLPLFVDGSRRRPATSGRGRDWTTCASS